MRLERFFEKFELFADAPNAVGKMRELVLDLAVTARLIPSKTEWAERPLNSLATKIGSGATPAGGRESYFSEGIPLIRSMNIHFRGFDRTGLVFLSKEQAGQLSNVVIQPGDVLLNITGASIGRVTIAPPEMAGARVNQHVTIIRPSAELISSFLVLFLASPSVQRMIDEIQVGATRQALTKGMIEQFVIPLPPLTEQKRIVAKVDELMALCDRLEAQQQERDTRHVALARASLTRFAEAPTPANLDFLFHQSYPITPADLRKAILSLAIQGQLILQNIDDESASVALNNAGVDLKRWAVAQDNQRFEPPESWTWIQFAGVGEQRLGKMLDAHKNRGELKPYLRNTNVQWMRFELEDVKEMRVEKAEENVLRLRKGDLLICEGGEPGRCAIWNDLVPDMYFQKALHRVRPCEAILAEYLALNLQIDCQNDVLAGYFTGATIKHFTGRSLSQYPVPIPPLAEQRRIVAKVDQLMIMVDQLESQLAETKTKSTALLDAVIHELLNPSAEIVDLATYRAAMACYAIRKMAAKPYFGRTAAMKLFYLAQAHVGLELDLRPLRDAAGPLDQWIYDFEKEGAREDWFRVSEGNIANGKKKVAYQPGRMLAEQCAQADRLLSASQRKEYDRLLELFADKTTEEAEIIATLFAAWNDFLIDGHSPSDDQIVIEVREHWHERKGRFTPTVLRQWLAWLRQNNLVPTGRQPHTAHQPQLLLN